MRSWFFLFSCNLMWALQFTCIKLVQDQIGSLFTVWGPMTLATLMLLAFALRRSLMAASWSLAALGCAGSIIAILAHSAFEFQMYVPANVLTLAWISGVGCGIRPFCTASNKQADIDYSCFSWSQSKPA